MSRRLTVIGAPSGAGACGGGQEQGPAAMRAAGLIEQLGRRGVEVTDLGDSTVVRERTGNPWLTLLAVLVAISVLGTLALAAFTATVLRRRAGSGPGPEAETELVPANRGDADPAIEAASVEP